MTARPHQRQAAEAVAATYARNLRGYLLADDVGTGKTISCIESVKAVAFFASRLSRPPIQRVLVVTTLAAVPHWQNTIRSAGDGGLRWAVINYDRLKSLLDVPALALAAKRTRTRNKRIAENGTSLIDWDVVILDEAHKLRHLDSQRAMAAASICTYDASHTSNPPFVLWASATAGQNPLELAYLYPLLAQVTGQPAARLRNFGEWLHGQGFAVDLTGGYNGKPVWAPLAKVATPRDIAQIETIRSRDIERMNQILFSGERPIAMRRIPTNIAGWPEVPRQLMPVVLTPPEQHLYATAWTEFRREMHLAQRGRDPRQMGMAARVRFRQKASLIRVHGTVEIIRDLLDNGKQVAVSVAWIESLDAIKAALESHGTNVAVIDGTGRWDREQQRLTFQTGQATVALFTVTEAISLHASEQLPDGTPATSAGRVTVVHDPRYSGIDSIQIEGRAHRDGQYAPVLYTYAQDTIEEAIVKVLLSRVSSTKAMVGDDVTTVRLLEDLLAERALAA
jgi:hypothetical protein